VAYSPSQIYNSLIGQGATPSQASTLTQISGAESSYGANTVSGLNRDGSRDYGVFQINSSAWPQYGGSAVNSMSLDQQSAAAINIYNTQGPTAWTTYKNGTYANYDDGSGGASIADAGSSGIGNQNDGLGGTYGSADQTGANAPFEANFPSGSSSDYSPQSGDVANTPAPTDAQTPITAGSADTQLHETYISKAKPSPLDLVDASYIAEKAGENIQSGIQTVGKNIGQAEANLGQTVASTTQTGVTAGTSLLVRSGFILAGIAILVGAFLFYYMEKRDGI
jgi:hypothetical protein